MESTDNIEDVDRSVGFLYRTMLERDPRKRRVKPVQRHLLEIDFGADDSSDDSDFEVPNDKVSGEESEEESDTDGRHNSTGRNDDTDEDNQLEDDEDEGSKVTSKPRQPSTQNRISTTKASDCGDKEPLNDCESRERIKVVICSICLWDISEADEVVGCDGCGHYVHEGCHGIIESTSVSSNASSASTEPWFCDACKANVTPCCELCPNTGGIFKETDARKWVHLVCALYVPGVAFGDVDKLNFVTLFEMQYSKWGAKECSLCDDPRFSRTGVCIGCDAGMCRTYFHVSCAQREGLLSEASPDQDIADPFYAYCRQHADKNLSRSKRLNWLAMQSHLKQWHEEQTKEGSNSEEKLRVQRKLTWHRHNYELSLETRPPSWIPPVKLPRMLTSSATAVRNLMRKAELLGIVTQALNLNVTKDMRKKNFVAPALSIEFISYFLDRNEKLEAMKTQYKDLCAHREKLVSQERELRRTYDKLSAEVTLLKELGWKSQKHAEKLWNYVSGISSKPLRMPEFLRVKKAVKSSVKRQQPLSPSAVIHKCGICGDTSDQHLLAKCDTCKLHYHLGCLQPPLSRMPKKTKLMGWQCSECSRSDSEVDDTDARTDGRRRLRDKIKLPAKFMPLSPVHRSKKRRNKTEKKRHEEEEEEEVVEEDNDDEELMEISGEDQPSLATEDDESVHEPSLRKEKAVVSPVKSSSDAPLKCAHCDVIGIHSELVMCDQCNLHYHLRCLDPPLKKSPKLRGYAWICTSCTAGNMQEEEEKFVQALSHQSTPTRWLRRSDQNSASRRRRPKKKRRKNSKAVLAAEDLVIEINDDTSDMSADDPTSPGDPTTTPSSVSTEQISEITEVKRSKKRTNLGQIVAKLKGKCDQP